MKLVLHNYFIIGEECFLEQLGIMQNHALNILGLYCDITDRNILTRPEVASRGPRKSIKQMGDLDSL